MSDGWYREVKAIDTKRFAGASAISSSQFFEQDEGSNHLGNAREFFSNVGDKVNFV